MLRLLLTTNIICFRNWHGVVSRLSLCVLPFTTYTQVRVIELSRHHGCVGALQRNEPFSLNENFCHMKIQPSSLGIYNLLPVTSLPAFNGKWIYSLCFMKEVHRLQTISMVWHYVRLRYKNIKNSMNFSSNLQFPLCFTQQKLSLKTRKFYGFQGQNFTITSTLTLINIS